MKPMMERKKFFAELICCTMVFPALAALLLFRFPQNALLVLLASSFCVAAAVVASCWRYLRMRDQKLEDAASRVAEYILDRRRGGIECNEEGAMYRLFHEVNSLVTIADARADSERRAGKFLRDTISDISHQIKTPLAALNIYNDIIRQEAEDTVTVREFAQLSERELDRMDSLIQSLLKMARLDAGAIMPELSSWNVSELLEGVRQQYSFRAGQEGKELDLQGDEGVVLVCDRTWLTEAIGNLVKNALDHTDRGDRVLVRWQQSPFLTQVMVEDTGHGIHPEDLYHIFKRFYRSRFSKDTQGVGLGLPLAKAIVEAHQGNIEVRSRLERGTVFTVNLPNVTK